MARPPATPVAIDSARGMLSMVGIGKVRALHERVNAQSQQIAELVSVVEPLRQQLAAANAAAAASHAELRAARSEINRLHAAIELDKAMASEGPLRVSPSTFAGSAWANDMLTLRVLERESQRRRGEVSAAVARGDSAVAATIAAAEANLAAVSKEVTAQEAEVEHLLGRERPSLSHAWEAARKMQVQLGALPPHEEGWRLETWLHGVIQAEVPRLLVQVPFEMVRAARTTHARTRRLCACLHLAITHAPLPGHSPSHTHLSLDSLRAHRGNQAARRLAIPQ